MGYLLKSIEEYFPTPERDLTKEPIMYVARSFDTNRPGKPISELNGGILGGAIKQGVFKIGEKIEIQPGYENEERNQKIWKPLRTDIRGIMSGSTPLKEATPGGSIALLTGLDPSAVKSDKLTGSVVGLVGKLPPLWYAFKLEVHLLERVVGTKDELLVEPLKKLEMLMLNVNSAATVGVVTELEKNHVHCKLKIPVCAPAGSRVTISRRVGNRFRLIGYGIIKKA